MSKKIGFSFLVVLLSLWIAGAQAQASSGWWDWLPGWGGGHGPGQEPTPALTVLGPVTVVVSDDHPNSDPLDVSPAYRKTFTVSDPKAQYYMEIQNRGARYALVRINQSFFFGIYRFKSNDDKILVPVKVKASNKIGFATVGKENTSISVKIFTDKITLPSSPTQTAPAPVAGGSSANLAANVSFLYTGSNPIQTGVAANTILPARAAVLRGQVLATDGTPLAGALITVLGHTELGQTFSRADGAFDMAVNGGLNLTLNFQKDGYLPVQRRVTAPRRDYAVVSPLMMTATDPKVTVVQANSSNVQVATASKIVDSSGTRQARVLFPSGTTAKMVFPNGTTQTLSTLNVRATEFTVGDNGPRAMPGALPMGSAYTYAVELSADEALSAGATHVTFNKPLYHYVENFLGFPVGTPVPVGFYDRDQAAWVASQNGRVIKILSISGGIASIDVNGGGQAATAQQLATYGFTDAERRQLAQLYTAGQSLWRTPVPHFSVMDDNFPAGDALVEAPPGCVNGCCGGCCGASCASTGGGCKDYEIGSIVDPVNQVLRESIPIAGTSFSLNYSGDRIPDRLSDYTIDIPLTGANISNLLSVELTVSVAGQYFYQKFTPSANLHYAFTWDGKDAYGRTILGTQTATVTVYHNTQAYYNQPAPGDTSFGIGSGAPFNPLVPARQVVSGHRIYTQNLGSWDQRGIGLAGWSLSAVHHYDFLTRTLYYGTGEKISAPIDGGNVVLFAGTGQSGQSGTGVPATQALLEAPNGLAQAPDGTIYIADNRLIRKVDANGVITNFAGGGTNVNDGVSALQAQFGYVSQIALSSDGTLYLADTTVGKVRRISPQGIVTTLAGGGTATVTTTPKVATQTNLYGASSLALSPDGTIYLGGYFSGVYRLGTDGNIILLSGTDGLGTGLSLTLTRDGTTLYIANGSNVWKMGEDLSLTPMVSNAAISNAVTPNIDANGVITYATNSGEIYRASDGNAALLPLPAAFNNVTALITLQDGSILLTERDAHQVKKIVQKYPGFTGGSVSVASSDGAQLYDFDQYGKHIATRDALTGATLLTLTYDSSNRITALTDVSGNKTLVTRSSSGVLTGFTSPYGVHTTATVNSAGYLASITDPNGGSTQLTYTGAQLSLLSQFRHPNGGTSLMTYDGMGRLTSDQDPVGGIQHFGRTDNGGLLDTQYTVNYTSATGLMKNRSLATAIDGTQTVTRQFFGLGAQQTVLKPDGGIQYFSADGTHTNVTVTPDPRYGFQAPVVSQVTQIPPAAGNPAITRTVQQSRSLQTSGENFQIGEDFTLNGDTSSSLYQSTTRTTQFTSAAGRTGYSKLDAQGRLIEIGTSGLNPVQFSYDLKGRLSAVAQGTRGTSYSYDSMGYLSGVTNALNQTTSYQNDALGHPLQMTLADGRVVKFTYDANGNMTSLTPPAHPPTTMGYSLVDLLLQSIPPLFSGGPAFYNWEYDLDRRMTKLTYSDGSYLRYLYDSVTGKMIQAIDSGGGGSTYTYDSVTGYPKVTRTVYGNGLPDQTITRTYQGPLLVDTAWTGPLAGQVHTVYNQNFDENSKTVWIVYPVGSGYTAGQNSTTYDYDADNLLVGSDDMDLTRNPGNGLITASTYHPHTGGITLNEQLQYDLQGAMTNNQFQTSNQNYYSAQLTYDSVGRITKRVETVLGQAKTWEYGYDASGRLTSAKQNGAQTAQYVYDANNNRLQKITPQGTETSTYTVQDQIRTSGTRSYTFNQRAQITSQTDSATGLTTDYLFNSFANFMHVGRSDGKQIYYLLNGDGQRIIRNQINADGSTVISGFLYDSQLHPIAMVNVNGNLAQTYQYLTKNNVPDTMYDVAHQKSYRIISDERGSVRLVIDGVTGEVVQQMEYDEFGVVTMDTNPLFQPFGFAGGLYDPLTGFVHFGMRDYDARTGRWITQDPIGFKGGDTNLYGYVLNDPVNFVDSTGLITFPIFGGDSALQGIVAGAIAGGATGAALGAAGLGVGAIPGAVGGAIIGGLAGIIGNHTGGTLQTGIDMTTGAIIGGGAGAIPGAFGKSQGGAFGGALAGAIGGAAYCGGKAQNAWDGVFGN